jgi:PAP2 superfamily
VVANSVDPVPEPKASDLFDEHSIHATRSGRPDVKSGSARSVVWFIARQLVLVLGAVVAYFGVRGLTQGAVDVAHRHARWVLDLEQSVGIAFEDEIQRIAAHSDAVVTLGNWVYIWLHWPVIIATLLWLAIAHRDEYFELRNSMFISGAIGLVIFATFPVAPPRLVGLEYVDTVTLRSYSYRVLQPPAFVNAFAAVPSLHFGWNLLVGLVWFRLGRPPWSKVAGVAMPLAMAWAVVVTANHWIFDVVTGGAVALAGLVIEREWRTHRRTTNGS